MPSTSLHRVFSFSGGMLGVVFFISKKHEVSIAAGRGLVSVLMLSKRGKGSVGEGEAGKKTKTTPDTGGKSDRADDIQEERDDNGGDDAEEDDDNIRKKLNTLTRN